MALINTESLLIYLEIDEADPPPVPTADFLVGIFDVPDAGQVASYEKNMKTWNSKGAFGRLLTKKPAIRAGGPKAVCKAAAYLQDNGKVLVVKNVGAEQGFGPTLYAVVMELARARGREGVLPSIEPGKILEKPKLILRRFYNGPEYKGKVLTTPVLGHHSEDWLNMVYHLEPNASLLDYKAKRTKWKAYDNFWKDLNGLTCWRDDAFDMARRSVEAHVFNSYQE